LSLVATTSAGRPLRGHPSSWNLENPKLKNEKFYNRGALPLHLGNTQSTKDDPKTRSLVPMRGFKTWTTCVCLFILNVKDLDSSSFKLVNPSSLIAKKWFSTMFAKI